MHIPSVLPRVFVSSVIEGFQAYRKAARDAIVDCGGEPVLVNEDSPSLDKSSRNACLEAVASCDVFVLIIGLRGGWRTPSGLLVVEEELEEARRRGLPVLVFVEDGDKDEDARRLSRRASDYVDGYFRVQFQLPSGLAAEIRRALPDLIASSVKPRIAASSTMKFFKEVYKVRDEATLRVVTMLEIDEEAIDPRLLGSRDFAEEILEMGHSRSNRLFSYQQAKAAPVSLKDSLTLEQPAGSDWGDGCHAVRVELFTSGALLIDCNVSGCSVPDKSFAPMEFFQILTEDIELALSKAFRFAADVYARIDPYMRYQRLYWNAAIGNIGHRSLVSKADANRSSSVNIYGGPEQRFAFDESRLIARLILAKPQNEIERAIHSWTRSEPSARGL